MAQHIVTSSVVILVLLFSTVLCADDAANKRKCYSCHSTTQGCLSNPPLPTLEQPCGNSKDWKCVTIIGGKNNTEVLRTCAEISKNPDDINPEFLKGDPTRKVYVCSTDLCNSHNSATSITSKLFILPLAVSLLYAFGFKSM